VWEKGTPFIFAVFAQRVKQSLALQPPQVLPADQRKLEM
jgi:hypothetical protein